MRKPSIFAKIAKTQILSLRANFLILRKFENMPRVVFDEGPKTELCFEISQRQQTFYVA